MRLHYPNFATFVPTDNEKRHDRRPGNTFASALARYLRLPLAGHRFGSPAGNVACYGIDLDEHRRLADAGIQPGQVLFASAPFEDEERDSDEGTERHHAETDSEKSQSRAAQMRTPDEIRALARRFFIEEALPEGTFLEGSDFENRALEPQIRAMPLKGTCGIYVGTLRHFAPVARYEAAPKEDQDPDLPERYRLTEVKAPKLFDALLPESPYTREEAQGEV